MNLESIQVILDAWRRRDSFATAALGGMVAGNSHSSPSVLARQAYSIADAMLLESESRAPAPAPDIDGAKETQRLDWILAQFANGSTVFEGIWTREDIDKAIDKAMDEDKSDPHNVAL